LVEKYKRDANTLITIDGRRSRTPNLKDFLIVVNNDIHFINCDEKEFDNVKHVRNIFTHYNPEKHITEGEWRNANQIIKRAFYSSFDNVIRVKRAVDEFFFVIPDGMMNTRIR
jgi:hypothetical protein